MAELCYVIGASGVGKDSLLRYAREHMPPDAPVIFAHRYITRAADAGGENHIALSTHEFHSRSRKGCFAMQWHSHQTWYGIGIEINQWLAKGLNVVMNGSRAYLEDAASNYPELAPVLISANSNSLRERLAARGRESSEEIEERLSLAAQLDSLTEHPRLIRIDNNGPLAEAGENLVQLIQGQRSQACA
jgi:ribose 1,5-bisphosphokinase